MALLIDKDNLNSNEYFRLSEVFDSIAKNPKDPEIVRLQLLMQKAIELYKYTQKVEPVAVIKGYRYMTGKVDAQLAEIKENEIEKECDKCFELFYDYKSARYNLIAWKDYYKDCMRKMSVYEPFFDSLFPLVAKMSSKLNDLGKIDEIQAQMKEYEIEMDKFKKAKLEAEATLLKKDDEIKHIQEAFKKEMDVIVANLGKFQIFTKVSSIKSLKNSQMGLLMKMVAYQIMNGTDEIPVEACETELKISVKDLQAIMNLPFMKVYKGGTVIKIEPESADLGKEIVHEAE